jgi:hypothetical protein
MAIAAKIALAALYRFMDPPVSPTSRGTLQDSLPIWEGGEIALGEAKEFIVALDCVEIDQLAPTAQIVAAQDLADRVSAMLTKLIRSV